MINPTFGPDLYADPENQKFRTDVKWRTVRFKTDPETLNTLRFSVCVPDDWFF